MFHHNIAGTKIAEAISKIPKGFTDISMFFKSLKG
jgi:hypothetical protein